VQYTCPSQTNYPGQIIARPPVKAMVEVADAATADLGTEFYAIALWAQGRPSADDMRLNEVATEGALTASSATEFTIMMNTVYSRLTKQPCAIFSSTRPAAWANVTVRNSEGFVVAQGYVSASGIFGPNLPTNSGPYSVEASHTNVQAPQDPNRRYRNYSATLAIPLIDPAQPLYNVLLTTHVQCP